MRCLRLLSASACLLLLPLSACGGDDGGGDEVGETGDGDTSTGDGDTGTSTDTSTGDGDTGTDTSTDTSGDTSTDTTGDGDTGTDTDTGETDTGGGLCSEAAEALAGELTSPGMGCTVVLRFDYQSLEPLAWSSTCGPYVDLFLDEAAARVLSECCDAGSRISPMNDDSFYVFYAPPGDFGGVTAVSNHLATRVFEGTIVWDGAGDIMYPAADAWMDPDALADSCGAEPLVAEGYDLISGGDLDPDELDAVMTALADTATAEAIALGGVASRVVVLAYPRSVGVFDPNSAEYVVIVETDG